MMLPPGYFLAGAVPSEPEVAYTSSPPFTATTICLASGLHASPSTWGSLELRLHGPRAGARDGEGDARGETTAVGLLLGLEPGLGDATGSAVLIGVIVAP